MPDHCFSTGGRSVFLAHPAAWRSSGKIFRMRSTRVEGRSHPRAFPADRCRTQMQASLLPRGVAIFTSGAAWRRRRLIPRRVGEGVAPLAPHRSGRADFPHPVPRARVSLTMSWTTISAVLHTGTRCSGRLFLGSPISSAIHAVSWTQVTGPRVPQCFSAWFSPRGASRPSLGSQRAWFPALTGTMKALRLPTCASAVAYFVRFRRPRDPPALCSP